jgi:RNase H-like domain found in reverse transcriptase
MVITDASDRAIGGYYGQDKDYKTMTPAAFHSQSFNSDEKNYPTYDKEMLAIVDYLKRWEPQLTGIQFEVLTDHKPLMHLDTKRPLPMTDPLKRNPHTIRYGHPSYPWN